VKLVVGEEMVVKAIEDGGKSAEFETALGAGATTVQGFVEVVGGIFPPHYVDVSRVR
jgi:hypothetical protein